ncbi:DUF5677 domain-containing protein [Teredinibacter haidensis]|uniref:DUF5677 domain-containing protein n=1 Tax=Teredinibacter haidensis TaxID=2731755 RepID=UPI000948B8D5|nr:DUF5677 domain-containing protein [Teredinibacter haidensis]
MFKEIIESVKEKVEKESGEIDYEKVLNISADTLYGVMEENESDNIEELKSRTLEFEKRNCKRWELGFQKLEMLREISLEAGMEFQSTFLKDKKYEQDPLLGVLMRQHANACRVSGEIILLLKGGYPDGALARWRTLFEISVNCLILRKYGREAAEDYIRHGQVKSVEGMEEYQKTADEMKREPYLDEDLISAQWIKEQVTEGEAHFHWARKYAGFSKLDKLREDIGLGKWSFDYKLASRNVHADYYEMLSLLAMSESEQDMLLAGQSNSGMVEPAHMTAIALAQITVAFLTTYIEEDDGLDYTDSTIFMMLIQKYVDAVGDKMIECSNKKI